MDKILLPIESLKEYKYLVGALGENIKTVEVHGISDAQKSVIAALLSKHFSKSILLITHNDVLARKIYEDICCFDPSAAVLLPSSEMVFHKIDARSNEISINRLKALNNIISKKRIILCASVEALLNRLPEPEIVKSKFVRIKVGDQMPVEDFWLTFLKQVMRVDMIEGCGQFSIRGGIIDFYGPINDNPVRIELFDDEIDSIRYFDLETQRSIRKLDMVELFPMREMLLRPEDFEKGSKEIEKALNDRLNFYSSSGKKKALSQNLKEKILEDVEKIKQNIYFQGIEKYAAFFYEKSCYVMDYIEDFMVVIDEANRVRQRYENVRLEYEEHFKSLLEEGELLPDQINALHSYEDVLIKNK